MPLERHGFKARHFRFPRRSGGPQSVGTEGETTTMAKDYISGCNALVCFLDLLGTSKVFIDAEAMDERHPHVDRVRYDAVRYKRIHNIMRDNLGKTPQIGDIKNHKAGAYLFSDSAFLICPLDAYPSGKAKTDNEWEFGTFLGDIADCQRDLLLEGVIARGYITFGRVFLGKDFLVGPAVCRAVANEKGVQGPFVVIDKHIFSFIAEGYFRQQSALFKKNPFAETSFNSLLLANSIDNTIFVNYMWDWWSVEQDGEKLFSEQKRLIESEGLKNSDAVRKCLPLASYHNYMAEQLLGKLSDEQKPRFYVSDEIIGLLGKVVTKAFRNPDKELENIAEHAFSTVVTERKQ